MEPVVVAGALVAFVALPVAAQVPTTMPPTGSIPDAEIHWHTDAVDLRAEQRTLRWDGQTFSPVGAGVTVSQDIHAKDRWNLYARWEAGGHDNALGLRFRIDGPDWFVESIAWTVTNIAAPGVGHGYLTSASARPTPRGQAHREGKPRQAPAHRRERP